MAWGLVRLPGRDAEYSVYATEAYYAGPDSRLRRFTFRVDGFVSLHAEAGGELVTKPLQFEGKRLLLNFSTSEAGTVRIGIEDEHGTPIELAGRPVRLRFGFDSAHLYSFVFR